MRVSPIALVYHKHPSIATENAVLSSQVTHPYSTNAEACKVYTQLMVIALSAGTKEDLASPLSSCCFKDPDLRLRFAKYNGLSSFAQVPEADISSSGYVVHSLEASLWAFFITDTFLEGALKAVNLGDDADTVVAIYGGLAGAYYGVESIPAEWVSQLRQKEVVDKVVEDVVSLVTSEA